MASHWQHALPIALFLTTFACSVSTALPSVVIDSPSDGTVLPAQLVNVTGTASGSDGTWSQGDAAEFSRGTMDKVALDGTGRVELQSRVTDDFNDNTLDPRKWTLDPVDGVTAVEEDGGLHIEGRSTSYTDWRACAWVWTVARDLRYMEAKVKAYSGSGNGYSTGIVLWQDDRNYIGIGLQVEPDVYGEGIQLMVSIKTPTKSYYASQGLTTAAPHTYSISYLNGRAALFQDGVEYANESMSLSNTRVVIKPAARNRGDTTDSVWDDVKSDYHSEGTLLSSVFDSRVESPILRRVGWNATAPAGTEVRLQVRSSSTSDMRAPTPWSDVENDEAPSLPEVRRYIQYRAILTTSHLFVTPTLSNVSITYHKPVTKVEVSIDGGTSWTEAFGTDLWHASLVLPEGNTAIWARASDSMGEVVIRSVTVAVNTTPPRGSVLINGGDVFTDSTEVTLALNASSKGGVMRMKVGHSPDLGDAVWTDYSESLPWILAAGDGRKVVYITFMDMYGRQSDIVNDWIILDTLPPLGNISINHGAKATNTTAVTLGFQVFDVSTVVEVLVSEDPMFENAQWLAFRETMSHNLSTGDGNKTVYARFKDRLGHVSGHAGATILLDTQPPDSSISAGIEAPRSKDILVQWEGFDALSGVLNYDVQVRTGEGSWSALVGRTNATTGEFRGDWGETYYFRVRATDSVGNRGAFSDDEADFAKVTIPARRRVIELEADWVLLAIIIAVLVTVGYLLWRNRRDVLGPG